MARRILNTVSEREGRQRQRENQFRYHSDVEAFVVPQDDFLIFRPERIHVEEEQIRMVADGSPKETVELFYAPRRKYQLKQTLFYRYFTKEIFTVSSTIGSFRDYFIFLLN